MMHDDPTWDRDFPIHEQVEDFSGEMRAFTIACHETGLGFTVIAEEDGTEGNGFQFRAYSETTPYSALGRLRAKMHRSLATRHLSGSGCVRDMLHDTLQGRITSDRERGVLLIVDGKPLDIDDVAAILDSHEGWEFELRIKDALE